MRRVQTTHIQHMLRQALELAEKAEGEYQGEPPRTEEEVQACLTLERATNLAAHASQELEDERLRLRDGWPE